MKFIIIIYTTNKLTVVEMEDIRGVRLRKFKLRKILLGVRMHFHHIYRLVLLSFRDMTTGRRTDIVNHHNIPGPCFFIN